MLLGNIAVARSYSIPLALREFPGRPEFCTISEICSPEIKAIKEGIFKGERYSRA
jgi:translation initiation factor 2 alpha subunit (eIF-2alpha)